MLFSFYRTKGTVLKERGFICMKPITQKQLRVYDYIRDFIATEGYPPTVREIGTGVGLNSPATVKHHLDKLVELGFITVAEGKTRAIALIDQEKAENMVPLLGHVAAGAPILANEHIEDYIPFDTGGHNEEFFALRVRGESMLRAGILPDDCVVVHQQEQANNGEIVVALLEDEATVKTLSRRNGKTWLNPENDAYDPIDGTNARILGKVVAVIRYYS